MIEKVDRRTILNTEEAKILCAAGQMTCDGCPITTQALGRYSSAPRQDRAGVLQEVALLCPEGSKPRIAGLVERWLGVR